MFHRQSVRIKIKFKAMCSPTVKVHKFVDFPITIFSKHQLYMMYSQLISFTTNSALNASRYRTK